MLYLLNENPNNDMTDDDEDAVFKGEWHRWRREVGLSQAAYYQATCAAPTVQRAMHCDDDDDFNIPRTCTKLLFIKNAEMLYNIIVW